MTDVWGANTFPVRKFNSRTFHLKLVDHTFFHFFRRFPQNKRWWRLRAYSFLGTRTRESYVALQPKGRLRQLATPRGTIFLELGHLILCNVLSWLPPLLVSLNLSYVLVYITLWCFYCVLKCMHEVNIYSFDAHKHQHYLHTRWFEKGPYTWVRGNIRSGGESMIMLGLRLAWLQWTLI